MRFRSAASEAFRNVGTRASRPILSFFLFVLGVGALMTFDMASVRNIIDAAQRFSASGASVTIMYNEGAISGSRCEGLSGATGVRAAGAVTSEKGEFLTLLALPSSTVPTRRATPGFAELLARHTNTGSPGVVISRDVASAVGVTVGDTLATDRGSIPVAGVYDYPHDGRISGLGWAILIITPATGGFDECWVDALDSQTPSAALLTTTTQPNSSSTSKLGQLNSTLGASFDGRKQFLDRATHITPYAALLYAFVLGFISKYLRRLELASALHAGMRKSALAAQIILEETLWLIPASVALITTAFTVAGTANSADLIPILLTGARTMVVASCGVLIGATAAVMITREKHLFTYFRSR